MTRAEFNWDLEDDPEGNYWHICVEGHGVTREEVEEVVAANFDTETKCPGYIYPARRSASVLAEALR